MSDIDFTQGAAKEALDKAVAAAVAESEKGLKTKNAELLAEKKALETKYEGVDVDEYKRLKKDERDKGDEGKDAKAIRERVEAEYKPQFEQLRDELKTEREARKKETIDRSLTEALTSANISNALMTAAKDHILARKQVDVGAGGATIDGKPASEFVQGWAAGDGKAFVAAADNTGGGSKSGTGSGAPSGKKASEMSRSEKVAFIKEHGEAAWQKKIQES